MKKDRAISYRLSPLLRVGLWVGGIASIFVLVVLVIIALDKVRSGRGLDTYRTFWLVEDNSVGLLVFLGVALVALAVGLVFFLKERRELRQLQAKYSGEHHG